MNMVRNKALRCSWAVLCCAVLAGSGSCAELTRVELPAHSTIDELLRLDSQAALEAARKNIFGVPNGVVLGCAEQQRGAGNLWTRKGADRRGFIGF